MSYYQKCVTDIKITIERVKELHIPPKMSSADKEHILTYLYAMIQDLEELQRDDN